MADRVPVRFRGEGAGSGPLAWGQAEIWAAMRRQRNWLPIGAVTPLPAGTTIADVAADLRFLMSRHPSLRTTLRFGPGRPIQVVAAAGEVGLEIVEATPDGDPAAAAARVEQRYRDTDYDFASEWPVRMAVVRHRGAPTHRVTVMSHLVTDGPGATVMFADLAGRDRGAGDPPASPMPPLEQARWQQTAAAQRVTDAALRRWERLLRTIPPRRLAGPGDPQRPRYWQGVLRSPALPLAVASVAARTGADLSAVLLAAFAVALARRTGIHPVVAQVVVSNRFRPGLASTVSPINQTGLCVLDVADMGLDEAIAHTRQRVMAAYKHAYYDPRQLDDLVARVTRERGDGLDIDCFFNDRRLRGQAAPTGPVPAHQLRAALPASSFWWDRKVDQPFERLFVHIDDLPDDRITVDGDTHHVPPAELAACARGIEEVLVAAALDQRSSAGGPGAPPRIEAGHPVSA